MTNFYVAKYFWDCGKALGVPLPARIVRFLDHLLLNRWRYNRYVAQSKRGLR